MGNVDFAQLADQLGLDLEQVLEAAALGPALVDVATAPVAGRRVALSAEDLEHGPTGRARPETDAEYAWAEAYGEHWSV